jgi:ribonuclease BN (tRNA processing enzyme)
VPTLPAPAITAVVTRVWLRVIGSGDAFSSGGRFQTALLLEGGEESVLIDCGATTLTALKREAIDPASLGWVALSHLHGDHFGGLPWMILDGQFARRTKPLVVAGPPGVEWRLKDAFEALYPGAFGAERPFELRFVELRERAPAELGPAVVTAFEVLHGSGATPNALRIEYGARTVAYSGDTEWTDALIEVARGADLFICECNFFDKQVPGHLNYTTLAAKRDQLDCGRLVLTHMSQDMLSHLGELELEAAADGMVIEL